jgi:methyltransferase (TIGR00027 family)
MMLTTLFDQLPLKQLVKELTNNSVRWDVLRKMRTAKYLTNKTATTQLNGNASSSSQSPSINWWHAVVSPGLSAILGTSLGDIQKESRAIKDVDALLTSDKFPNTSALMIAYERHLESQRPDALFIDPYAKYLHGGWKGEELSMNWKANAEESGFPGWPEFHQQLTACRTKFIDDKIEESISNSLLAGGGEHIRQLVNLGAGFDTRSYRLPCYENLSAVFELDLESTQCMKTKVFGDLKVVIDAEGGQKCPVETVSIDFLSKERSVKDVLLATGTKAPIFEMSKPSIFLAEGLFPYFGKEERAKVFQEITEVAAPGSVFIFNYIDATSEILGKFLPPNTYTTQEEIRTSLLSSKWTDVRVFQFGDDTMDYGRYMHAKFDKPNQIWNFVVCKKE